MKQLIKAFIISLTISHAICGYSFYDFLDNDCSYFEDIKADACESIIPGDTTKKCSFYNNQCITTYRKCEDYKINVQKEICESISLEYSPDKKCVFESNQCVEKERSCSEFKIGFEAISNCYGLHTNDENKLCVFKNNKCEGQYKKCEDYKDNIQKDICESIQPFDNDDDIDFS